LLCCGFANKRQPVTSKRRLRARKTAPPATGVERQRKYRSRRKAASLDVGGPTIELIRRLRQKHGLTTDELISAALIAFDVPVEAAAAQPTQTDADGAIDGTAVPKPRRRMSKAGSGEGIKPAEAAVAVTKPGRPRSPRADTLPEGQAPEQLDLDL